MIHFSYHGNPLILAIMVQAVAFAHRKWVNVPVFRVRPDRVWRLNGVRPPVLAAATRSVGRGQDRPEGSTAPRAQQEGRNSDRSRFPHQLK